jgi:hypothetical protein
MLKSSIKPGIEYALREKRAPRGELQRVRIIEHTRGNKWKAEWIEPNPGLVHYVESSQLVALWKEHRAFLKEEENEARLKEESERNGYRNDSPVDRAMYEVFESVADGVNYYRGTLSGEPEAIARVKARAGADPNMQSPFGYVDRGGKLRLPFGDAVDLARAFCGAEPSTVLISVEGTERDWGQKARTPGEGYMIGLLNEYRAAWALIRQWAGHDAGLAQRDAELQKAERLVWDAIYALQKAGLDKEAARLRRAMEKR